MNISAEQVLLVIGAGATVATVIFYGSFYLGQIWHRLGRLEDKVSEHDKVIAELRG